jgi:CheY-like chemotaxis protein
MYPSLDPRLRIFAIPWRKRLRRDTIRAVGPLTTVATIAMSSAGRPRILLIDDDPNVREVLQHLLASFGYDAHTAAEGTSGLVRFDEGGWDLVLVDIVMPAISGWGVVETIRRRTPTTPVVLITGMNQPAVMQRARDWRLPVIVKPFRADAIRAIVATALQSRPA